MVKGFWGGQSPDYKCILDALKAQKMCLVGRSGHKCRLVLVSRFGTPVEKYWFISIHHRSQILGKTDDEFC